MRAGRVAMEKAKKKNVTWGEAAKVVLASSSCPLTHKEILQVILEKNLKEVKLSGPAALACINAMLHANSRTPSDLFHKVEGRTGCYEMNKNRVSAKVASSKSSPSSSTSSSSGSKKQSQQQPATLSGSGSSNFTMPTGGSLPPISSMLGGLPGGVTTTTSVTSSVSCAIDDSRLSSLIAPSSDNLPLPSALAKKRSVKPRFQGEGPSSKKPRVTFKLDKEKKGKQERSRPQVKTKAELKCIEEEPSSQNFIPPMLKPPMDPTHVVKGSSGAFFGQKRHKKMSIAAQVKRSMEGVIDLVSPDSILSKMNVRTLINFKTFHLLPSHHQYQLAKMLPECDREIGPKGDLRPSSTAFTNEFFTSAFRSWRERLSEGEFTPEMTLKIQQEQDKFLNEDPWKAKHFEPVWGLKMLGGERYVSPVEKSHQIMRDVHAEHEKELERQRQEQELADRETENEDLSAPNKMRSGDQQDVTKNLTTKQRAALLRQQKLANAKSAKKAKKASEKRARENDGKKSSKDGQNPEKAGKTKSTSKKQNKISRKLTTPDDDGPKILTIITAEPVLNIGEAVTADKVILSTLEPSSQTTTQVNAVTSDLVSSSVASRETVAAVPPPAVKIVTIEKAPSKSTKKKVIVKTVQKVAGFSKEPTVFHCTCLLKAMVICRLCGAFCHADCINPMSSICRSCAA